MDTTVKTNKYIFFCFNLLLMLLALKPAEPVIEELLCAGVFQLLAFCCVVLGSKDTVPASAHLTTLFFFDFWSLAGLYAGNLAVYLNTGALALVPQLYLGNYISLAMVAAGVLLAFIGLKKAAFSWLLGLAGGAVGASVILLYWIREDFSFYAGGAAVLAVFLLGVLVWTVLFQIALCVQPEKKGILILLGVLLLCGAVAICTMDFTYIQIHAVELEAWVLELPELLTWERVGVVCAMLAGGAAVMSCVKTKQLSLDSLVMSICALLLLAVRFLMSCYFLGCWIVLLLFVMGLFRCLKRWVGGQKTFGLSALPCLAVLTGAFLLTAEAFHMGLWLNVLILAVFGRAACVQRKRMDKKAFERFLGLALIALLVAEAMAWQWKFHFSREGIMLLVTIYVVATAAFLILDAVSPSQQSAHRYLRLSVFLCTALLCLASTRTAINVRANMVFPQEALVKVTTEEGAPLTGVVCHWDGILGQGAEDAERLLLSPGTVLIEVPIRGHVLTVEATDARGVRASRDFWYPWWLYRSQE